MEKQIKKRELFAADVFHINTGTEEQRQQLITEVLETKKLYPQGNDRSNPNCWRADNPCRDISWLMQDIAIMMDEIVKYYEDIDPAFKERKDLEKAKVNYWANVNGHDSYNVVHSHKLKQFSAVYYLQGEGTGQIAFINPANLLSDCNWGSPFTRDFQMNPKDGDLIIWPAWVPHQVSRNESNRERINLVFDIDVKEDK